MCVPVCAFTEACMLMSVVLCIQRPDASNPLEGHCEPPSVGTWS